MEAAQRSPFTGALARVDGLAFLPLWAVLRNSLAAEVHGQDMARL